jgi:hypothetical protein
VSIVGHRLLIVSIGRWASVADCRCQLSDIDC